MFVIICRYLAFSQNKVNLEFYHSHLFFIQYFAYYYTLVIILSQFNYVSKNNDFFYLMSGNIISKCSKIVRKKVGYLGFCQENSI